MHLRAMGWAWILALGLACRSELFAPGLGRGVEGAEKPGAQTRAQAFSSLAFLEDKKGALGTFPVVAVRPGKVIFLLGAPYPEARLPELTATFHAEDGATETVSGGTAAFPQGDRIGIVAFPAPRFPVRAALVTPADEELAPDALRVVELRKGGTPIVQELTLSQKRAPSSGAQEIRGTVPAPAAGRGLRVILDGRTWHLVGLVASGSNQEIWGRGVAPFLRAAAGAPRRAVLRVERADETCRIAAEVEVKDPLGTILEAGLVLGEPGVAWAIPEVTFPPRDWDHAGGARASAPPSPVVPVGKKLAARARPVGPERFRLSAEVKGCDEPRFAQIVLLGERERWLSWPYRLEGEGSFAVPVAPARLVWRVDEIAAALPLEWTGKPVPAPPEPGAAEGCRQPLAKLDPDRVHVVATRGAEDAECANGLLVFPAGAEERALCMQREEALVAIGADGVPLYGVAREKGWRPDVLRRAAPDRNERANGGEGACELVSPRLDDDVLASAPACERPGREVFTGPGGELVVACHDLGYVRRDGSTLDLRGGALVRLGEKGTALVVLPWGMLGVLAADGKGREVGGLPLGVRIDRPMPSAALAGGFLVALERAGEPGSPELFHVSLDGTAESRGRFGPLGADAELARHLDGDGALYTLGEHDGRAEGKLTRWDAGGGSEVLYDPALRPAQDRLELRPLLLGWRSAGPATPGPALRVSRLPIDLWAAEPLRKELLASWTLASGDALPCRPGLDRLDPDRVWIQIENRVFDPADPGRFLWAGWGGTVRIGGDGSVLGLSQGRVVKLPIGAEALRPKPDGSGCAAFPGGTAPAPVSDEACPEPERKGPHDRFPLPTWLPVPGSAAVLLRCPPLPGAAPVPAKVGDRELPAGYRIAHAGSGGQLLLELSDRGRPGSASATSSPRWVVLLANGRKVPVAGLTSDVYATRAVAGGFLLVVPRTAPVTEYVKTERKLVRRHPPLDLLRVGHDGRVKKLATVPPLDEKEELLGVAVTADEVVRVLHRTEFHRARLVRFGAKDREPVEEWQSQGEAPRFDVRLLTGP